MGNKYCDRLICYLSDAVDSYSEIERLIEEDQLSKEEAAMVRMRVAVEKLERKVNKILEEPDRADHETLQSRATSCSS